MSLARKTATYAGSATVIAILVILAANTYVGTGTSLTSSLSQESSSITSSQSLSSTSQAASSTSQAASSTSQAASDSVVLVQLTDPPTVPVGTTSLNLTYSAITLLVSEPSAGSKVTTTTVSVTPTGGSATVNLLKLENVSQTIATANLPSGSTIYSATFSVSSISIEINKTSNPVTLATGGSTFVVTLTSGTIVKGTNAVLLDLNPTVVETPVGYQMIPSSVGILRPQAEVCPQGETIGWLCPVTGQDWSNFNQAKGQLTANLLALTVSGSTTTITVEVVNSGTRSIQLVQVGLEGNLTVQASSCTTTKSASTTTTSKSSKNERDHGMGQNFGSPGCWYPGLWGQNQLLFTPVSSTSASSSSTTSTSSSSTSTSSTGCATGQMSLSNGIGPLDSGSPLVLSPGQCIILTFKGTLTFNQAQLVLVPSTATGQVYILNVVASNNAQTNLSLHPAPDLDQLHACQPQSLMRVDCAIRYSRPFHFSGSFEQIDSG